MCQWAIFSKTGRCASEPVILRLLRSKCMPILLYAVETGSSNLVIWVYINSYLYETFSDWFAKSGKWLSSQFWLSSCQKARYSFVLLAFCRGLLYQKTACACCLRMMHAGSCIVFLCKLVIMSGPRASCAVLYFLPSWVLVVCMCIRVYTTKQQTKQAYTCCEMVMQNVHIHILKLLLS